jgi:hypothetical protein
VLHERRRLSNAFPGVVDADQIAELQRQLLLESSHTNSASSTHVTLDDVRAVSPATASIDLSPPQVLRCLLDRYMAHQARLAALVKASFKEATARDSGGGHEYDGARASACDGMRTYVHIMSYQAVARRF